MSTAPGECVCVCVCVSACVRPLLQVCVCSWMGQIQRTHFTADYTLYVKKNNNSKPIFFFFTKPITDYGKMLKYREKYRSTDISVGL